MKRALVLSLICVVGLTFVGFAQTLTGSWSTSICLDPQTDSFAGAVTLSSKLIVTYAIGDWAFTSTSVLTGDGWTDQDFSVTGLFGLITVSSALAFDPVPGAFDYWKTTLGLNMAGVTFGATFQLGGKYNLVPVNGSKLILTGVAGIGSAVVGDVTIVFGSDTDPACDFDFQSIKIGLDFTFCDCAAIESDIYFTCDGFQYVQFVTKGIAIPNMPWMTLDAKLYFETQTKEITLTPVFDLGAVVCFDLYVYTDLKAATYPYDYLDLELFTIEGIGISCDIGGVTFSALSNWHDFGAGAANLAKRPGLLAGKGYEYWEVYSIGVDADACCGGIFDFTIAVFFAENAVGPATMSNLFDIGLIEAAMKVNVTEQMAFTMNLSIDAVLGFTKVCFGFDVTW